MRKFIVSVSMIPLLAVALLIPMATMAASPQRAPHFFLKSSVHSSTASAKLRAGNNLSYHGGPVMAGTAKVYAIFWEPTNNVQSGYNSLIQQYFGDVNGTGLYKINTQYKQSGGTFPSAEQLATSYTDTTAYPETPLLDSDIQNEVTRAQIANHWTSGIDNIFFVFLQKNEDLCFDSTRTQCASNYFCAYHSYFGTNTIYAAMPYAASFSCNPGTSPNHNDADQTINVSSHEQMEAATDPLLNAWYDRSGNENGDKCAWKFGTLNSSGGDVTYNGHSYILQKEWDNARKSCVLTGP